MCSMSAGITNKRVLSMYLQYNLIIPLFFSFWRKLIFLILSWYCYPKLVISYLQNLSSHTWYCQKSILTSILHHFSLSIFQERSVLLNLLSYILFNVTIIDLCMDVHIERHEPITFVRTFWWNAFNPIHSIKGIFNGLRHERVHSECLKNLARIRPCSVMCWTCGIYDWSELGKMGKIFLYFGKPWAQANLAF